MANLRPRSIRCARCNKKVKVAPTGRIPVYCGNNCRQIAFMTNLRGTPVSSGDRQRVVMWELLQDAGLVSATSRCRSARRRADSDPHRDGPCARSPADYSTGAATRDLQGCQRTHSWMVHQQRQRRHQLLDSSARNTGRSITGSNGSITIYDASGRITGRSTISNGTTTLYDASGRRVGTTTTSKGR